MIYLEEIISFAAKALEIIGISIIVIGVVISLVYYLYQTIQKQENCYKTVRRKMGKSILLGLEVLVAADIIATVVTEPTMNSVLTLGVIIIIRILLSFSLQVELEGKFPWQAKRKNTEELS